VIEKLGKLLRNSIINVKDISKKMALLRELLESPKRIRKLQVP